MAAIQEYCSQTEIDALNGYVARESLRLGLAAPNSEALAAIVAGRQHHPMQEVVE